MSDSLHMLSGMSIISFSQRKIVLLWSAWWRAVQLLRPACRRSATFLWLATVLAALCLLVFAPLAVGGCGHATVPCPTPTQELDRLRAETEQARADMDRALAEDRALKTRRETAAQRAMVARQMLDSLAAAGAPRALPPRARPR